MGAGVKPSPGSGPFLVALGSIPILSVRLHVSVEFGVIFLWDATSCRRRAQRGRNR